MSAFDQYIFHFLVFAPAIASIFITLIPTVDMNSKFSISRFFSAIGFLSFCRLYVIFLDKKLQTETAFSFAFANFNINFSLALNRYNLFLYGAAATLLLVNMFANEITDTRSNIHQVAPFLLTFFLNISFGQTDLRVALPILSIANLLVYFLIGSTDKIRRGSTIFQMGIFLFSCDALTLVLLQIIYSDDASSTIFAVQNLLLIIPGLARLCLPLFTPFMKKLFQNVDSSEGPFLLIYLQLSGFLILELVRSDMTDIPMLLTIPIACVCVIGGCLIALVAVRDFRARVLPYYFLVFYSSLAVIILYTSIADEYWFLAISLLLTNMVCFFNATRMYVLMRRHRGFDAHHPQLRATWFMTLALLVGFPGLGIGTSLWAIIFHLLSTAESSSLLALGFWHTVIAAWCVGLLLLSFALVQSVREEIIRRPLDLTIIDSRITFRRFMLFSPFVTALLSIIIPLITLYAAKNT